jgi:hypothetical protein
VIEHAVGHARVGAIHDQADAWGRRQVGVGGGRLGRRLRAQPNRLKFTCLVHLVK